jgi:hypothetical protein
MREVILFLIVAQKISFGKMMVSDTGENNVHVCSCTSRFDGWHASWTICGLSRNYESQKTRLK